MSSRSSNRDRCGLGSGQDSTIMANDVLTDYLDAACEAARRGAAILEDWRGRFQIKEKGRFDLVTDADVSSQVAVRTYLAERFPEHGFLGEEEGGSKTRP